MHTYKKIDGDMTHDDTWHVGYYTMEANYNAGMAGGIWPAPGSMGGGGSVPLPAVVSTWHFLSEHESEPDAIDRVNVLNGGAVVV